ncbi:MAG: MBL fold metallo-hydrolase [Spirochaetota bacterium]
MSRLILKHLKGNTYYFPSLTNVGLFNQNGEAILIDSGNDKDTARQILHIIEENGWNLKLIINTHSNADHIGGNAYLQGKTSCRIAATRAEAAFIQDPILEPSLLYGGFPHRDIKNKFLLAQPSNVSTIIPSSGDIPETGLRSFPLPGHFVDMIGVYTPDRVFFIGDCVFPQNIIEKYHLFFLYDIKAQLKTLETLKTIEAEIFVPGHGVPVKNIEYLILINTRKIRDVIERILDLCSSPVTENELVNKLCSIYHLNMDPNQNVLVSSTVRSYLSYMLEEDMLEYTFSNSKMLWKKR